MTDTNKRIDPSHEKRLKTRGKGVGKAYEPFIKVHELSSQGEIVRIRSASVGRVVSAHNSAPTPQLGNCTH